MSDLVLILVSFLSYLIYTMVPSKQKQSIIVSPGIKPGYIVFPSHKNNV